MKFLEKLVKIKDELRRIQHEVDFLSRETDHVASEMIEYLREKKLLTFRDLSYDKDEDDE